MRKAVEELNQIVKKRAAVMPLNVSKVSADMAEKVRDMESRVNKVDMVDELKAMQKNAAEAVKLAALISAQALKLEKK